MTIFLDESVPVRLSRALAIEGRAVNAFPKAWKGLKNGELLRRLREQGAMCLITCDKNLHHQQAISSSGLGLVVLPRQRFEDLVPLVPAIADAMARVQPGAVVLVNADGSVSGL